MAPSQYQHHLKLVATAPTCSICAAGEFIDGVGPRTRRRRSRVLADASNGVCGGAIEGRTDARADAGHASDGRAGLVSGTRDGRPAHRCRRHMGARGRAPADGAVQAARGRAHAKRSPAAGAEGALLLPSRAAGAASDLDEAHDDRAPATTAAGLHIWVTVRPGVKLMEMDEETRARLEGAGVLGQ